MPGEIESAHRLVTWVPGEKSKMETSRWVGLALEHSGARFDVSQSISVENRNYPNYPSSLALNDDDEQPGPFPILIWIQSQSEARRRTTTEPSSLRSEEHTSELQSRD